jgi:cysteine-rich repeat protein
LAASCLDWAALQRGSCGDGFVGPEERCDDGNRENGDGCSSTCELEVASCGNLRREVGESCDDGNRENGDGCDAQCKEEPPVCGDGRLAPHEDCDDGNLLDGDGCSKDCSAEVVECGDGEVGGNEACDDGNRESGDGCSGSCELEAPQELCGNGVVDAGEPCDDGNTSNQDFCLNGCSRATCGDGFVRRGVEECDDGNLNSGDGCTRACMVCSGPDGSHFRSGNSHCYTLHLEPKTQAQARAVCQRELGDLWTVTSAAEGNDLVTRLELVSKSPRGYWLGLITSPSAHSWVTGEGTMFTSFGPGEPKDPALGCVRLQPGPEPSFTWQSLACSEKLPFVCERVAPFVFATTHHAYRLHTGAATFDLASASCQQQGGYLATLNSDDERSFVGKAVQLTAWVGASDRDPDGVFRWIDGSAVEHSFFANREPSDGDAGCLLLLNSDRLAAEPCDSKRPFVCEFE